MASKDVESPADLAGDTTAEFFWFKSSFGDQPQTLDPDKQFMTL
jgi:hypothetical protein